MKIETKSDISSQAAISRRTRKSWKSRNKLRYPKLRNKDSPDYGHRLAFLENTDDIYFSLYFRSNRYSFSTTLLVSEAAMTAIVVHQFIVALKARVLLGFEGKLFSNPADSFEGRLYLRLY